LVESYGTWLLFQRLDDSSKDSDIPKNVPFAFAINNRNTNVWQRYNQYTENVSELSIRVSPYHSYNAGRTGLGWMSGWL
jgi:hypothetical protein